MLSLKSIFFLSFIFLNCKAFPHKQKETGQNLVQNQNNKGIEILSIQEADLLNSLLKNSRDTFDFQMKNVAFITGSSGTRIVTKTDYFNTCVNPWLEKGKSPQIFMVKLTVDEKNKSGGYDALVLSWVKVFTAKQKRKVIEQLAKK
jgi:hypothetical protein